METNSPAEGDAYDRESKSISKGFPFLSEEQRARYGDLSATPYEKRTPEQQESVERLVLSGYGYADEAISEFLDAKNTTLAERTPRQRYLVLLFGLQSLQRPETVTVMGNPKLRAAFGDALNKMFVPHTEFMRKTSEEREAIREEIRAALEQYWSSGS